METNKPAGKRLKGILAVGAVIIAIIVFGSLAGCDEDRAYQKEITSRYELSADLEDCKIFKVNGPGAPILTVVRCGSTTSTNYEVPKGKGREKMVVITINGVEYEVTPKKKEQ